MFTGIVETVGKVIGLEQSGSNLILNIQSDISSGLKIDQSISHNGVCLTVTDVEEDAHQVTVVDESLKRSNLGGLSMDDPVNLERCMKADGRFDGHIVQGHVDTMAIVDNISSQNGSWIFRFELKEPGLMVEKGSVCMNGISLTCFDLDENKFSVAIIPYTFEHTNVHRLKVKDEVNIEFDILGKYIQRILNKA